MARRDLLLQKEEGEAMTRPDDYGIVAEALNEAVDPNCPTCTFGNYQEPPCTCIDWRVKALAALERLARGEHDCRRHSDFCAQCDSEKDEWLSPVCLTLRRDCLAKVKGEK